VEEHPLFFAARWLEKNMHQTQTQYYRGRASKYGMSVQAAMIADILGFFNVQDADICKQIKKNNFVIHTT